MQIRILPSAMIRRKYNKIAEICRKEKVPIFLTKNGGGDLVAISVEQFLEREQEILLREKLVSIEKRRRAGVKDSSAQEVRRRLQELIENYNLLELTQESEYPARGVKLSARREDCPAHGTESPARGGESPEV